MVLDVFTPVFNPASRNKVDLSFLVGDKSPEIRQLVRAMRKAPDGKRIDYDRSSAFAMVDHQIAHIYCRDLRARDVLSNRPNLTVADPAEVGLSHRRKGDLILLAAANAWLDYRWWSDPKDAPAFAKMVDIHRKPGYDPLELFWDRATNGVSQNADLIRGSHGLVSEGEAVFFSDADCPGVIDATAVAGVIEGLLA